MRINSKPYSTTTLKQVSGYVMQDDLLFAHITVEETLQYAATLRLANTTEDERRIAVNNVIQQLGLESCRRTIVGNAYIRGVSGGERKRLCVAIELLTKPKILFLDEPTSGLGMPLRSKFRKLTFSLQTVQLHILCVVHLRIW